MPEKLTKCPRTVECTARVVWQDDSGELFRLDKSGGFVAHICTTKSADAPKYSYTGEFFNPRTGQTRHTGPVRSRQGALRPPADGHSRKRTNEPSEWVLKALLVSVNDWKPVKD